MSLGGRRGCAHSGKAHAGGRVWLDGGCVACDAYRSEAGCSQLNYPSWVNVKFLLILLDFDLRMIMVFLDASTEHSKKKLNFVRAFSLALVAEAIRSRFLQRIKHNYCCCTLPHTHTHAPCTKQPPQNCVLFPLFVKSFDDQ